MISSPPQEAEHIRGTTLTPESPKPVHFPSPANIPILMLEKQMDPMFHEAPLSVGTPASFQSYPQQTQTPSAHSTTSYHAEQQNAPGYQNAPTQGVIGAGYSQSTIYGGHGSQSQDTSIHTFLPQNQASATSYSEANSAPAPDSRSAYPPSYDANPYAAQAQASQSISYQNQAIGGIASYHIPADSLSPSANDGASERYVAPMPPQQSQSHGQTSIASIPTAANLPPRPPAQEKPSTHPNFSPNDDIRMYHPHSQKPTNSQYRGSAQLQPLNIRNSISNPSMELHSATRSNQSPTTPGYGRRHSDDLRSENSDDEDSRWPPEVNRMYEGFLDDERKYVTDGQWDQFPMGSRLFIGNLPTEKVTKRDIFHRFYRHGKLAQISIKQAYGFVQFLDAESCHRALAAEQGKPVRGRKMHLEVSKPQRNTKKADHNNDKASGPRRRSRSPDYTRGGTVSQSRNNDRHGSVVSPRDRDNRRFRDDYRPNRSPSPRGGRGTRGRDRSRDRYDGRRRSRSRSPRRYRSPSPKRDLDDDDLPLPFRASHQIPDIQVLVVNDSLPRDYIGWVEDSFRKQGLRIDVLILSPRLSEAAVVRRQIIEGVLAIVKLNTSTLAKGKVNLQVFDRRGGGGNVSFNEYADLDPTTAAALVTNMKQSASQPIQPPAPQPYGQSYNPPHLAAASYGSALPQGNPYPLTPAANSSQNLSNLISTLDSTSLSQLLSAMSNPAQTPQPQLSGPPPDLARLLGQVPTPAQPYGYTAPTQPAQQPYQNAFQNSSLAALLGGQPPARPNTLTSAPLQNHMQAPSTGQPDMNEIMAQLAKYQR